MNCFVKIEPTSPSEPPSEVYPNISVYSGAVGISTPEVMDSIFVPKASVSLQSRHFKTSGTGDKNILDSY